MGTFAPMIGKVPGQVSRVSYGVCYDASHTGQFEYLSGVEVMDASGLPAELATVRLPAREYAVFKHRDNVSSIASTIDKIWKDWVPQADSKYRVLRASNATPKISIRKPEWAELRFGFHSKCEPRAAQYYSVL